jgi:hypothetical protein
MNKVCDVDERRVDVDPSQSNRSRDLFPESARPISREVQMPNSGGCPDLMLFGQGAMVGSKCRRRQRGPLVDAGAGTGVDLLAMLTP